MQTQSQIGTDLQSYLQLNTDHKAAQLLLQTLDPTLLKIMEVIRPILIECIIEQRQKLLSGEEIVTINRASKVCQISRETIYNWIERNKIGYLRYGKHRLVSIKQIRQTMSMSKLVQVAGRKPSNKSIDKL